MYRVLTKLESIFIDLEDAQRHCECNPIVYPRVPATASPHEDKQTKRICVSPTIEGCLTGIGLLGNLRRCLSANEDAFSYATDGLEVYPIIVEEYSNSESYYKPTIWEVEDQMQSGEHWIRYPTRPLSCQIFWLDMFSIIWKEVPTWYGKPVYACDSVTMWRRPMPAHKHPWFNGLGHVMDCSDEEIPYKLERRMNANNVQDTLLGLS